MVPAAITRWAAFVCALSAPARPTPADIEALISNGQLEAAEAAIASLEPAAQARFTGLLALEREAYDRAIDAFNRAVAETEPPDPRLYLYLAHAQLLAGRPGPALAAAREARGIAGVMLAQPLLEARAHQALGSAAEAYAVLIRAAAAFPGEPRPLLELAVLTHKQGIHGETRRWTSRLLAQTENDATLDRDMALSLFQLLASDRKGLPLLEAVAARYPRDGQIKAALAHAYAESDHRYAAARLFEAATRSGSNHAYAAADQFRLAGRYGDALRINREVRDPSRRKLQRLTILFEAQAYARVIAIGGALTEPAAVYRQAYAHYALGNRSRAAERLRTLLGTDSEYAAEAQRLLEAMNLEPEAR